MTEIKIIQTTAEELKLFISKSVKDAFAETNPQSTPLRTEPFTKIEVMRMFKVSMPTLDRWNKRGQLKNFKIGRRVYYNAFDVIGLLESKNI